MAEILSIITGIIVPIYCALINFLCFISNHNNPLKKWLQINIPLYITNRSTSVTEDTKPKTFFAWDLLDSQSLVNGNNTGAILFFIFRFGCLLYFSAELIIDDKCGTSAPEGLEADWLIYFTDWTFIGFGLYGLLGLLISLKVIFKNKTLEGNSTGNEWQMLEKSFLLIFTTVLTASLFLTLFYWGILHQYGDTIFFDNLMRHGINVVILIIDLFLSQIPIVSCHIQVVFGYGTIYLLFMWIYFGFTGKWIYTAMDWSNVSGLIYYLILPILLFVCFFIIYALAWLREKGLCRTSKCTFSKL